MACLALAASPLAAEPAPALPDWMAGAWQQSSGDRWTEEYWTPARGGIMIGAGRNGRGETLAGWETMRIVREADGGIAFFGSPEGAPPTRFPLVRSAAQEVVFANPAHDYPQRIRYWREGKLLKAEIALADGERPMRWTYAPMGE
ncbi:hypothetical protein COO09_01685 [Rhizorhabdus dicambivorans]|uniref:DUF6265 domain-containing protein n=1 Tax=Rhizorhabdus dicambivorans TaxID=1850238 RepID=A0A2A4G1S8_9SPHN|nr:hypothetical protein CMV14_12300 [Rhizorhabdus dicambivorans]PCE44441.1 hypothetical protein COO09_01685 [Rhizorhabdus dicambivorans]